jgi:hypothetical protein
MVLTVQVVRYVDNSFPGWVECEFLDAENHRHTVVEKVPVVTTEDCGPDSTYPQTGGIRCEILTRWQDARGRDLVRVTTSRPDGVESTEGVSDFAVLSSQVVSAEATIAELEKKAAECEEKLKTQLDREAAALRQNANAYREWIAALKGGHWRS